MNSVSVFRHISTAWGSLESLLAQVHETGNFCPMATSRLGTDIVNCARTASKFKRSKNIPTLWRYEQMLIILSQCGKTYHKWRRVSIGNSGERVDAMACLHELYSSYTDRKAPTVSLMVAWGEKIIDGFPQVWVALGDSKKSRATWGILKHERLNLRLNGIFLILSCLIRSRQTVDIAE